MCQHLVGTGQMLAALDQYRPDAGSIGPEPARCWHSMFTGSQVSSCDTELYVCGVYITHNPPRALREVNHLILLLYSVYDVQMKIVKTVIK